MSFITSTIPVCLFLVTYFFFKRGQKGQALYAFILPALLYKLTLTCIQGWVYIHYYGGVGDIFNYYQDANILINFAKESPERYLYLVFWDTYYPLSGFYSGDLWEQPRALFMVKLLSIVNLLSLQQFWPASFLLSLLNFMCLWMLANQLVRLYPHTRIAALIAFLLFPSSQFWTSGFFKENIAIIALCGILLPFLSTIEKGLPSFKKGLGQGLCITLSTYILLKLKFYYLAVLMPCLISYFITEYYRTQLSSQLWSKKRPWLVYALAFFVLILGATQLNRSLKLDYFVEAIIQNHNIIYQQSRPEDLIHYHSYGVPGFITLNVYGYGLNLFLNSPLAFFSAVFRPFLWEAGDSKLKLWVSLENIGISLALLYTGYYYWRKAKAIKIPAFTQTSGLLFSTLLFISILFVILALSTPNLGSLHRYKVAGQLFLIYLIAIPITAPWEKYIRANET